MVVLWADVSQGERAAEAHGGGFMISQLLLQFPDDGVEKVV